MIKEILGLILLLFIVIFVTHSYSYSNGYEDGIINESKSYIDIKTDFQVEMEKYVCPEVKVNFPECPIEDCVSVVESTMTLVSLEKARFRYEDLQNEHEKLQDYIDDKNWNKCMEHTKVLAEKSSITETYFNDYYDENNFDQKSDENFVYGYLMDSFDKYRSMMNNVNVQCSKKEKMDDIDYDYKKYTMYYNEMNKETEFFDLVILEVK